MVTGLMLAVTQAAQVVELMKGGGDSVAGSAGRLTLTWLLGVALLVGVVMVGFKKSKRTHLD